MNAGKINFLVEYNIIIIIIYRNFKAISNIETNNDDLNILV